MCVCSVQAAKRVWWDGWRPATAAAAAAVPAGAAQLDWPCGSDMVLLRRSGGWVAQRMEQLHHQVMPDAQFR
jgi:hypothetical protein